MRTFKLKPFADLVNEVKALDIPQHSLINGLKKLTAEKTFESASTLVAILKRLHVLDGNDECVVIETENFVCAMSHLCTFIEYEFVQSDTIQETETPYPRQVILINNELKVVDCHYENQFGTVELPYDDEKAEAFQFGHECFVIGHVCV